MTAERESSSRYLFFLLSALAVLMAAIDATIVAVALPQLTDALHAPLTWVGWTLTAYQLVQLVMMPVAGRLSDTLGRKRVFLCCLGMFTLGSLLAALAGAFTAPTVSVVPGLGVEVIVLSFAVVVIGGLGSLPGAALGAVIVGVVRSLSVHYLPQIELFVIYFVMAMVLAFRPRGLFSLAEPRKI